MGFSETFLTTRTNGKRATRFCPCGYLGAFAATGKACRCTPDAIARYQGRLSGPLMDRIDLQVEVPAVKTQALLDLPDGESSAQVARRVAAARAAQTARQGRPNAGLDGAALAEHAALDSEAARCLRTVSDRLGWSARSVHRALKVARTIADLAGAAEIAAAHVMEAAQYRRGLQAQPG